jgi:P63C domain-containing protein
MQAWAQDDKESGRSRPCKGGIARAEALSPETRAEIARKATVARWAKDLPYATHEGTITAMGDLNIPCAVLNTGQRVIAQSGFMLALGRARQAKGRQHYKGDVNLPAFLTAQNLKPFVSSVLEVTSSQIEFLSKNGHRAFGYADELLPEVCDVFIRADRAGVLKPNQKHIADQAHIIMKALAHTGIAGLIDEATGYQEVRDRRALQAILDKYLRKELAAWAKRFPDEFYKEMFRLRSWKWPVPSVRRPGIVGKYTNDLVYERLAPGILEELEARNPKDEHGNRRGRHLQLLTDDVGHPALAQHLHAVIGLMRASLGWDQFYRMMKRAFPKKGQTIEMNFDD